MRQKTACFTGHRKITQESLPSLIEWLEKTIAELIRQGVIFYESGMATGFDTLAAQAVLRAREHNPAVKLIAVLPCANQDERWCAADKQTYRALLAAADKIVPVSALWGRMMRAMSSLTRLFIAINFTDDTRAQLASLCDELRPIAEQGNFTVPDNLHLTLAFLGECDARQMASAKMALTAVRFEPFTITISGFGYLGKRRPNLVFRELYNDRGRAKLLEYQQDLCDTLSAKGFKLDQRKFWPHITLGREVVWKDIGKYANSIDTDDIILPMIKETVTRIDLMKSERINGKLIYTSIYRRGAQ